MNKQLIAAGLMAAATTASHAQGGNIAVYGLIDSGVEYVTNVGAAGSSLTRVPTLTGTLPSRLGFRGTEDLGGGLKTVFVLENGFAPDAGTPNQGGRLFGRQAWVGLSGDWGTLSFGRQQTMLLWAFDNEILGPNVYGMGSIDSYIPNARADNSLSYRGTFGGVTIGATYSTGRDAVNAGPSPAGTNCAGENPADSKACREWSAMLRYDTNNWGVAATYDRLNGGPGAFAGLVRSSLSDSRALFNGWFKVGAAKFSAGALLRNNQASPTPKSDAYYIGASYPVTPAVTLEAELCRLNTLGSANDATLLAVRGFYNFSRRTAAYVTAGHIANHGTLNLSVSGGAAGSNPAPGGSQNGVMVGLRHFF